MKMLTMYLRVANLKVNNEIYQLMKDMSISKTKHINGVLLGLCTAAYTHCIKTHVADGRSNLSKYIM